VRCDLYPVEIFGPKKVLLLVGATIFIAVRRDRTDEVQ
jgi:hypothetical protein